MSADKTTGDWYDRDWTARVSITVSHRMVPGKTDLIGFPMRFEHRAKEFAKAQPGGADFLFTSGDGTTKLPHEIRLWDPANFRLIAYVRIPRLSAVQDTLLFLYCGNPNAQDQQDIAGVWEEYQYVRHLGDDPSERPALGEKGGTLPPVALFQLQIQVLEELFSRTWFIQPSHRRDGHPAYKHWQFCNAVIGRGGQLQFRDNQELHEVALKWARVMRDTSSLVQATRGNIKDFRLGSLANYGDERVARRLRAVIGDHRQYLDVLAELDCAGWHVSKGHDVSASETPGWADFWIVLPDWSLPVVADCKRLSKNGTLKTLKSHIERSNKQVKAVGTDCYGLAILNVTDRISNPRPLSDDSPREVVDLETALRRLLTKYYTAISAALLVWDEVSVLGPHPGGRGFLIALRTKSVVVRHLAPVRQLPEDLSRIEIQGNISSFVRCGEVDRTRSPDGSADPASAMDR